MGKGMEKLFPSDKTETYAARGFRRVDGWLTALDSRLVRTIGCAQDDFRVTGSVGEIGVHHGRLFILLYMMRSKGERAFAIDLFRDQHLNVDGSGKGDLGAFRKNIEKIAGTSGSMEIFQSSSTDITWERIEERVKQKARLFSIDGGHTRDIAYNDIAIASDGLADGGVIIIDDYFNADWPGVSEATVEFFCRNSGALAPFAIGENKLFVARPQFAQRYGDYLRQKVKHRYFRKNATFRDNEVAVFKDPKSIYDMIKQSQIARAYGNHPVAEKAKPIIRRIFNV